MFTFERLIWGDSLPYLYIGLCMVSFIAEDMKRRQIALKQVGLVGVLFMSFRYAFLEV